MCPKDNIIVCLCSLGKKVSETTKNIFTDAYMVHQIACHGNRKKPSGFFPKQGYNLTEMTVKNMIDIVSASITKSWIEEQIEVGLTQTSVDESVISPNDVVGRVFGPEHPGRVRCMGMAAAPTNTFTSNGVRLSHLSNSVNFAYTSSSNFWQGKYTTLEAAFKAYLMMKEGRIPQEVVHILGSSNPHAPSESRSPLNAEGSHGGSNI